MDAGRSVYGKTYLVKNQFSNGGDNCEDEQEHEENLADGEVAEGFASLEVRISQRSQNCRGREGFDAAQMRRPARRREVLRQRRWESGRVESCLQKAHCSSERARVRL